MPRGDEQHRLQSLADRLIEKVFLAFFCQKCENFLLSLHNGYTLQLLRATLFRQVESANRKIYAEPWTATPPDQRSYGKR
jgi:hypothetical protein